MATSWVSMLKNLRWSSMIMGLSNIALVILGCILMVLVHGVCGHDDILPFIVILLGSCFRIFVMVRTAMAQQATARMILSAPTQSAVLDAVIRRQRRVRYTRWVWWTRFLVLTTVVQFLATAYLLLIVAKHFRKVGASTNCVLGHVSKGTVWQHDLLFVFIILAAYVGLVQCLTGSDVLRWRSFYTTEDSAWKNHYRVVFDHGLRETLCCLGRVKYLTSSEEDEVYSVAQLLGDMVTYRASGTGHLELIAGLALFQRCSQPANLDQGSSEAPTEKIQEASTFHPFAEAAYTGPLLDIGRNHVLFPCAWLYRQGILSPWTRTSRPVLEGDNWWRGHAAAFIRYVNIPPEGLLRGRVNQAKCEAAYFIVVLHHLKSVVIAVRGTETPEDLITDGLGRECTLSDDDLDGLINSNHVNANIKKSVAEGVSHYGHSGIVEAARDLFMQIEGNHVDNGGFLSSLLGPGGDCDGYGVRIVGHSLGGAIAALLGIRLYGRFPNLHVYAYGPLPCLDPITADACSEFVTSIVYNNEFSSRLSVASIMRLRAAALTSMSQERTDADIVSKLARRFLFVSKCETNKETIQPSDLSSSSIEAGENILSNRNQARNGIGNSDGILEEEDSTLWHENYVNDFDEESGASVLPDDFTNPFYASTSNVSGSDPVSEFMEAVPSSDYGGTGVPEVFLPGFVVYIVPERNDVDMSVWRMWSAQDKFWVYKAYAANREKDFKDIIVAPSMFLDHLPWRCNYAMRRILEARKVQSLYDGSQMV